MEKKYSFNEKGNLFSHRYDDVYFSDSGGYEESLYVFLQANELESRFGNTDKFVIGELGFGTGLNFLISCEKFLEHNDNEGVLYFISCEKHLLSASLIRKSLENFPVDKNLLDEFLSKLPKNKQGFHLINLYGGRIKLLLLLGEAEQQLKQLQGKVDAFFFDGFSPKKNMDMWSKEIFRSVARLSKTTTTYSSFTVAGAVRKNLQEVGFSVERVEGFGYKRHMIRGKFEGYVKPEICTLPYFMLSREHFENPKIAIIGGGLAGTSLARVLSTYQCEIDLYEKGASLATGASGNSYAMAVPIIAKKEDLYANFTLSGLTILSSWLKNSSAIVDKGVLEFAHNQTRENRLREGVTRYDSDFVCYQEASEFKSFEQLYSFVEHKEALVISPQKLCEENIVKSRAKVFYNSQIDELMKCDEKWLINNAGCEQRYDIVILANSTDIAKFVQTEKLAIRSVRGQLINLPKSVFNYQIPKTLNYTDYLIANSEGGVLGATFDVDNEDLSFSHKDSQKLIEKLQQTFPILMTINNPQQEYTGRVSLRAVTADYFPLVGQVADYDYYQKTYQDLHNGLTHRDYPQAKYHRNLYCAVGYGARGLLSSFLSAEVLASQIFGLPLPVPESQLRMLHTSRFWIRNFKRSPKN